MEFQEILQNDKMDAQYERVINRLTELKIPYKLVAGSCEGLVLCTGAGRFSGERLMKLLRES